MIKVKRFISQRCLGYSENFEFGYYEGRALMEDGQVKTVHCIAPVGENGMWTEGECPSLPRRLGAYRESLSV